MMDELSLTTEVARLTDAVGEVKTTVCDIDRRLRSLERAAYIVAGVLVAAAGGTTLLSELLGS
jgi:hypothetical protein